MSHDDAETLMVDGEWVVRRTDGSYWVSHTGCFREPRRVREGRCHACKAPAPALVLGFLNMVEWER